MHSEVITGCQACANAAKMDVAETAVDEDTATAVTIGLEAKNRPTIIALSYNDNNYNDNFDKL